MPDYVRRLNMEGLKTPMTLYDRDGRPVLVVTDAGETTIGVAGNPVIVVSRLTPATPALTLGAAGGRVGFFGSAPVERPTIGVGSPPAIVAALRDLGLVV